MTPEEGGRKKPCVADMQLMCFSKTWDCAAYVNLVGKDMAMPGEDATMDLKLLKPMVLEEGQQFTVRDSAGTIGTGEELQDILLWSYLLLQRPGLRPSKYKK
jgi:elongation factor Tu